MAMKRKNWTPEKAKKRLKQLAKPHAAAQVPNRYRQGNMSIVLKGEMDDYRFRGSQGAASAARALDPESDEFKEIARRLADRAR